MFEANVTAEADTGDKKDGAIQRNENTENYHREHTLESKKEQPN